MKIVCCSKNPVKIQAVKEAFSSYFETFQLESLDMKPYSSVLLQPLTPEKTLESAVNRIITARKLEKADFFVSLEGGMGKDQYGAFLTAYVCVSNEANARKISVSGGFRMPLPVKIYQKLENDRSLELGDIIDIITGESNVKQQGGSAAVFTDNRIHRKDVFKQAVIFALIPFTSDKYKSLEISNNND